MMGQPFQYTEWSSTSVNSVIYRRGTPGKMPIFHTRMLVAAALLLLPPEAREQPGLARLFAPATAPSGRYRAFVANRPIERVAEFYRTRQAGSAGSWTIERLHAFDAFGAAGRYDRSRVARLYGGDRARVARGPLVVGGHTTASVTLISPFPDESLSRLDGGTLLLIVDLSVDQTIFMRPAKPSS
jgi:hypothetical protein